MRRKLLLAATLLAATPAAGCAPGPAGPGARTQPTLRTFGSEAELSAFHRRLARDVERYYEENPIPPPPPPSPPSGAPADPAGESVTNVQHAGVDEGGIVKTHGDHLVVLRRGRLFTVRIGGGALEPVAAVDAFGPGIDPRGAWYDEMLVSGDVVVVIGFSYARGGTEVGLFRIGADGSLSHRATYHLRSGDYYSSRNYASRLIGNRLVFYAPIPVSEDLAASFPAFRRWDAADSAFRRIAPATRVYRPAGTLRGGDAPVLHTVTVCDLGSEDLDCRATGLYGPAGRVFYVSPGSVYVWATRFPEWDEDDERPTRSVLFRMPLDGSAPTGLRVQGGPVDPLSFLESGDGHLNVLTLSDGEGDQMWGAEWVRGEPALLRVPLSAFGDGSRAAPSSYYRRLPRAEGNGVQNRFVGDWLLYGVPRSAGARPDSAGPPLYAVRWAGAEEATGLAPPHGIDRIEAMGTGAVVVGSDGRDLHFTGVRLGATAALAERYTRPGARQGESRTHGFFYRPEGPEAGLLGLPVRGAASYETAHLSQGSASILFLRNDAFRLTELGELAADEGRIADDGCRASCVDWYGNARPLFLRGRVFALMGYELVEGAVEGGRIREVRRVSFAPRPAAQASSSQ
ncbi:MAG TPA: beta-propeller domain-containing protein [Longimicrobium sp.]|nr:beta-propeller domain-containing protein [Longimicrobium sp.]